MNEEYNLDPQIAQLEYILEKLEDIKQKLILINTQNGNLARYQTMKAEIIENGWNQICERYHPDFNIDDPAAIEVFTMYKFVYDTMDRNS